MSRHFTTQVTVEIDEIERVIEFPARHEICADCDGHGTTLAEALRGDFTASEFVEVFDDEESRAAYFQPGGAYDVQCETCKGARVTVEIDREAVTEGNDADLQRALKALAEHEAAERIWRRMNAAERAMGA